MKLIIESQEFNQLMENLENIHFSGLILDFIHTIEKTEKWM